MKKLMEVYREIQLQELPAVGKPVYDHDHEWVQLHDKKISGSVGEPVHIKMARLGI